MTEDVISILIVDDEPEARDLLSILLNNIDGVKIAGMAENADSALVQVIEKEPDLILLDIQMPGKNGFDLVASLRKLGLETGYIFITAYDEYAIEAVRASAFDYLLKPTDPDELVRTIDRFREEKQQKDIDKRVDKLLANMGVGKRLKLNTRTGFIVIDPMEIVCCEADGNYTEISMLNDRREIISSNLGSVERDLSGDGFFRISRSALINLRYLTHVDTRSGTCRLQGDTVVELKVARNRLRKLNEMVG
ncbi:MAG: response regulator transcription factor [Bacteroidales bacterium]|nr:response regulator transcription factor [Bacteroidales bacterium]